MITKIYRNSHFVPYGSNYYDELDIDSWCIKEHKDFNFTKRMKYVFTTDYLGIKSKEPELFVEISFKSEVCTQKNRWLPNVYETKYINEWITEEAIIFDFSDEIEEVVIDCA